MTLPLNCIDELDTIFRTFFVEKGLREFLVEGLNLVFIKIGGTLTLYQLSKRNWGGARIEQRGGE